MQSIDAWQERAGRGGPKLVVLCAVADPTTDLVLLGEGQRDRRGPSGHGGAAHLRIARVVDDLVEQQAARRVVGDHPRLVAHARVGHVHQVAVRGSLGRQRGLLASRVACAARVAGLQHVVDAGPGVRTGAADVVAVGDRAAVAVAFLLRHPAKILPVLGTNNLDRIKTISDALKVSLTREAWFTLYEATLGKEVP